MGSSEEDGPRSEAPVIGRNPSLDATRHWVYKLAIKIVNICVFCIVTIVLCLDKPYYGPGRRGPNSNEVKNQAQWAPLAQATQKVIF
jgi:hypothetical protein